MDPAPPPPSSGLDSDPPNAIAIIGMSCRFPQANNPAEFWQLLSAGVDAVGPFPAGRKNTYHYTDIDGVEGGFLKCPIDTFDAKFFGISPREAPFIDPQQRLLLEVIWEGLESAGIDPFSLKDSATGAFVGIWQQDYESFIGSKGLSSSEFHHRYLGNAFSATASRISYFLGLLGPNIALESGCSSSLTALHLACESLLRGEISLAISSGVNLTLGVAKPHTADTKTIVLSPDYRCKTFDAGADGFVRAEGCGALILKRAANAVRDGDNILAVIRGSAMNNDGAGTSFGTPNAASQEKVFRMALSKAGVEPTEVTYVEAHGTGTAVGDPIEMHALSKVYAGPRKQPLFVASVKTNIGHAESAAGIAGLIKTILSLQHKLIPAHLNLTTLNPHIDLSAIPAQIPSQLTEWTVPESGQSRRLAAVSSFSMSGTNVHVILQEGPPPKVAAHSEESQQQAHLVTISAKTANSLQTLAADYLHHLRLHPKLAIADIAYTTNACRAHFSHRLAINTSSTPALVKALGSKDYVTGKTPTVRPKVGFLFTGQGCQYSGMGRSLHRMSGPFRAAFESCQTLFQAHLGASLADILWEDESQLQLTIYCQPAIFCLQHCIVAHWAGLGVQPDVVLGHSVGEFAASVAAGILSLEQAMLLVIERSRLVQALPESRMLVLKTSLDKVQALLASFTKGPPKSPPIDIAAVNSSAEVVVSGATSAIAALETFCVNNHVKTQRLASSHAFHSAAMDPILAPFEAAVSRILAGAPPRKPSCTFISGTKAVEMSSLSATYWKEHLRKTVRFSDATQLLQACNVLVEIGPQPILLSLAMANRTEAGPETDAALYCPSLRRSDSDWNVVQSTLARLYIAGVDIHWPTVPTANKLVLPTYAFDRQKYWYSHSANDGGGGEDDADADGSMLNVNTKMSHPVLGRQIPCPLAETVYCASISASGHLRYIADHKVGGKIILPGAMYLEAVLGVGKELLGVASSTAMPVPLTVLNLSIEAALEVDRPIQLQTVVSCQKAESSSAAAAAADGVLAYKVSFHRPQVPGQYDNWKRHAVATFVPVATALPAGAGPLNIGQVKGRLIEREAIGPVYASLADKGIEFGPKFQSIRGAWTSTDEILTLVQLPAVEDGPTAADYVCHPIVLDAMFQTYAFGNLLNGTLAKDDAWLRLPLAVKKFLWLGAPCTPNMYLHSSSLTAPDGVDGVICLYSEEGGLLAVMEGLELIKVTVDSFIRAIRAESVPVPDFYQEVWAPRLGASSARFDLACMQAVSTDSAATAKIVATCNEGVMRTDEGVLRTNLLCFYHIVKCLHECNFSWPATGAPSAGLESAWRSALPAALKDTKIHFTFVAALTEEGYIVEGRVVRPLPSLEEVEAQISQLHADLPALTVEDRIFYEFCTHCSSHLTAVLQGKVSPLAVLFPADAHKVGASRFYHESKIHTMWSDVVVASFADLLSGYSAGSTGVLRILEVGAGTGATSGKILELLSSLGIRYHYTFTDISHGFLEKAEEAFGQPNMSYSILNLEQDPLAQGFAPHDFDIILSIQVLHATAHLESTLAHLQALMRPGGALIFTEQLQTRHFIKVSFALLEGWWRFKDFRTTSPIIGPEEWRSLLTRTGFSDISLIDTKDDACGLLIARSKEPAAHLHAHAHSTSPAPAKPTWLVFGTPTALRDKIRAKLVAMNRTVILATPAQFGGGNDDGDDAKDVHVTKLSPSEYGLSFQNATHFKQLFDSIAAQTQESGSLVEGALYLSTDDLTTTSLDIAQVQAFKIGGLLHFLQQLQATTFQQNNAKRIRPKVLAVSKGIHSIGDQPTGNPNNAPIWSAFRSFINECREYSACVIDLDQNDSDSAPRDATVEEIAAHFWSAAPDKFVVIRADKKYVHKLALMDKPPPPLILPSNTERFAFLNPASGSFSDIQIAAAAKAPLNNGHHIEVAVRAVALNFRDLLCVLKPPGFEAYITGSTVDVGSDISGLVAAIGPNVSKFQVGDAVFGFTRTGGVKSHTIVHEDYLMKKPKWMTFTGAATLPVVFLTSYYCLLGLVKMTALDRILIHVATGGVGLSAIQIAKNVGASIYATAGSKRKREYLRSHLGIEHVYNSRDLTYGSRLMADTAGAGVTIVLNSLTSAGFKEATLDCCAPGAQFIEIGKLNIWKEEDVAGLRPDVKYYVVDLADDSIENQRAMSSIFDRLNSDFAEEVFSPLPFTTFALERLRDAFYHFQEARHIGKIVIKMPEASSDASSRKLVLKHAFFNAESTYLVTGGLGGLGVEVTKWMTQSGARHIVLAGRSPPTPQVQSVLDQLNAGGGVNILVSQTDVGEYGECVRLLNEIKADNSLPPLRGIFLASGVLSDALIPNQSWDSFNSVFHPKVYSAWWLHTLTLGHQLEFFTMFSSMVAVIGMMGQSTHAAASRYLDSLAYYRVAKGLPAGTINWGAWSDVGAAAFLKLGQEGLVGLRAFTPSQGIHALEKFMLQNYTQACVLDVPDWSIVQQFLNLGSFLADLKSSTGPANSDTTAQYAKLLEEINTAPAEEKQAKIQAYLEEILKHTLRLAPSDVIDPDQNFTELGVDSLMAMEMRNRLQGLLTSSNKTLSINALQENRTLKSLSTHLAQLLNSDSAEELPILDLLKADSILPEDVVRLLEESAELEPPKSPSEFQHVLLTGGTGFLGSHLLLELLTQTKVHVTCLVRAPSKEEGLKRLVSAFQHFKVVQSGVDVAELLGSGRVDVVLGNVGADKLGNPEEYDALATCMDAVVHCAIKANHLEGYTKGPDNLRSNNVLGLINVLRFVLSSRRKAFIHASSLLAVTKVTELGHLPEEFPSIDDYTDLLKNGYSISKFVSEILLGSAAAAGLASLKVIRYPSIWGHSLTGFISLDNNLNHGWNLLTTCVRFRKFPFMDNTNGITIVPVDVAASVTVRLLMDADAENGVYNMTTTTSVTQAVMERIMEERGLEAEFMPISEWRNAVFDGPEEDVPSLAAFKWLYEDDGDELRFAHFHPLFAKQDVQVVANCVSDKMQRNLADVTPLTMSASHVLNTHLDAYLQ